MQSPILQHWLESLKKTFILYRYCRFDKISGEDSINTPTLTRFSEEDSIDTLTLTRLSEEDSIDIPIRQLLDSQKKTVSLLQH